MRKQSDKRNSPFEERKRFCPFSQPNSPRIDYKDIKILSRVTPEQRKKVTTELLQSIIQTEHPPKTKQPKVRTL